jgi:hypothetical protein
VSARKRIGLGLLIGAACAAGLLLWRAHRDELRQRMDFCLRTEASCLGSSLGQVQALADLMAKPRRSAADKAAALALLRGLRDCWHYAGDLQAQAPLEDFYVPLHQAEFWLAQSVQVGDDAVHLNPRRDAGILRMALAGLRGNIVEQRRNLRALAEAGRALPWTPEQARAWGQWGQSLQPGQ